MAEVELDCVFGHVITKAAVLRDSLDQGKYLLGNKTAALFEEAKSGFSKKNHYIVENNLLFFQKEVKDDTKRKCLVVPEKYPDAIPVANLCSTTVVNASLRIFSRMGFSRELQTDQGTSFMSALTTEFLERFGVKVVRSYVYHPQTLFALRTVIHDSTGFSPAELVHGKNLRTPVMLLYEKLTEETEEHVESSVVDYVFELINRMKRCQELAILHMEDAKQKQKLWYDRRTVKRQFQLSELVLVIAPSRPNKLSVQWVGPGEIVQQLSETNYVVKFPEKDKTHVYHVNMLKPYHQREENINLLCINPLKHDKEEDIPSLELENERSGWSKKIISDVQLNSKLSQIQRGQLKELFYMNIVIFFFEYSWMYPFS
ncbi:retrovirus-related Pol polyprotein from transposon 412 [Trichonephila clavipes]|nr:retrovirus-related Pol polyprotein from transposon 412 [Trichonephila clavipes]